MWGSYLTGSKSIISIRRLIGLLLIVVIVSILFFIFQRTNSSREYLVISHNDAQTNGGPITIYNLNSGKIRKPNIPMIGCNGISEDPLKPNFFIAYCLGSKTSNNLWSVNVRNGDVTQYPELPKPYQNIDVLLHTRLMVGTNGWRYLNGGGPGVFPNGEATNAYIVGSKDEEVFQVPISDRSQPYFILRLALDEELNKLWVMSTGNNTNVLLDRIDLAERQIDFSHIFESYSGFDLEIIGNDVVASTYRTSTGADITILDKGTGEKVKEITLPVQTDIGFNALSLLERNGQVYASSPEGVYVLSKDSYEIKDLVDVPLMKYITFLINGAKGIYAIQSYDQVLEIPDSNMRNPRVLLDAEGQGLSSLYYFINK